MKQTAFHDFYNARVLETLPLGEKLLPVYASSNIKIYPFQIAAADFALRSRYQKGTVLCDEAGLGKSHEAMLVIAQKWLEGARHILLAVPNADLLCQWTALLEQFYSVPYAVLSSCAQWDALVTVDEPNPFLQDAVVITTYEFAAANEEAAKAVPWDLVVFEEANALSAVYQEGNRQAKALKRIAGGAFKLLLTGTPIEKNIMDLYGLIWFIDETVLPDDREFLARYLRRPERYPELAELVRPYCFRTLRAQAQSYAKVTRRVLLTYEYAPSPQEQALYNLLYAYVNQTVKLAFQEMDRYDLALRLLGLLGSSTAAVLQTIRGVIKRLERMPDAAGELAQWREMETAALEVKQDTKAVELLSALKLGFSAIKKRGGARKAVIFTESVETQNMLFPLLEGRYKTSLYRGGADYSAIRAFKEEGEVLISTDNGARGFNLEVLKLLQSAYYRRVKMIYIDPPYNTGNDFVYADDFADPLSRYKEVTAQTTKSNPETMGRFHTNWLNMMYPRLRLAANLLRDDGVIFISIDDNEVDNLKKICNEVFGEENFVAQIVWQKRTSPDARRIISPGHEYILIYGKNLQTSGQVIRLLPFSDKDKAAYKNPDNDPRGPWISTDCTAQAGHGTKNQFYKMVTPSGRVVELPDSLCWRFTQEKMQEEIAAGRIWFGADGNGVPRKKTYLSERAGRNLWTWWPNTEVGHTQSATQGLTKLLGGKLFDFSKPVELVQRCLSISTSDDDIVLDFFSGSATTAHAVMQLNAGDGGNRRFILVQLPEVCADTSEAAYAGYPNICEIGKERIRRAARAIHNAQCTIHNDKGGKEAQMSLEGDNCELCIMNCELDTGFRVFKLDTSNLKTWDAAPIDPQEGDVIGELTNRMNAMIHRVKPDRSDLDMVFEVMLKLGVPPTYAVTTVDINGKTAYSVGEDCLLLVCLAPDVQPEDVEQMAEYAPAKAIISRDSFADDTAMANAYYILRDRGVELKLV